MATIIFTCDAAMTLQALTGIGCILDSRVISANSKRKKNLWVSQQTELPQLEETAQLKIKLFMLICRRKTVSGQQVLLEKEHCEGQRVVHIPGYTELRVCEGLLSPRRA